jgi:hypothetical protein
MHVRQSLGSVRVALTAILVFLIGALGAIVGPRIVHEVPAPRATDPWTSRAHGEIAGEGASDAARLEFEARAPGRPPLRIVRMEGAWTRRSDDEAEAWREGLDWARAEGSVLCRDAEALIVSIRGGGAAALLELDGPAARVGFLRSPGVGLSMAPPVLTIGASGTAAGRGGSVCLPLAFPLPWIGDDETLRSALLQTLQTRGWTATREADGIRIAGAPGLTTVERVWASVEVDSGIGESLLELRLDAAPVD